MIAPYHANAHSTVQPEPSRDVPTMDVARTHAGNHQPEQTVSDQLLDVGQRMIEKHPIALLAVAGSIGLTLGCFVKRRGA